MRFDRILCPVTFSPACRSVVWQAAALAAQSDGEVRLFHVLEERAHDRAIAKDAFAEDCERELTNLFALARHLPWRVRVSAAVVSGDPRDEILRHARLVRADLIAMGITGRDGSASPLVRHVAVDASCPVLAVPTVDGVPSGPADAPVSSILCAVNFLPASLAAADCALALQRATGAPVTVVHVMPQHWNTEAVSGARGGETQQLLEHHFRQLLQIAVRNGRNEPGQRRNVVVTGTPSTEIVRLARLCHASLIVTGIDRRTDADQPFGSTTAGVMDSSPCQVLLVPERVFHQSRGRSSHKSHVA